MTKYKVFMRKGTQTGSWTEHSEIEASSAGAAVRNAYMKRETEGITSMVAVPARSWKPTPIRTETVQKVVLGDVAPANSPEGAGVSPSEEA